MNDLAAMTGSDRVEVTLGGLPFRVGPLKAREWGEVQAWLKAHAASPVRRALEELAAAAAAGLRVTPGDRQHMLDRAREDGRDWPPPVGTAGWFALLDATPGGVAEFLRVALARFQPSITAEQAADLAERSTARDIVPVVRAAFGLPAAADEAEAEAGAMPEAEGGGDDGPKAAPPATSGG